MVSDGWWVMMGGGGYLWRCVWVWVVGLVDRDPEDEILPSCNKRYHYYFHYKQISTIKVLLVRVSSLSVHLISEIEIDNSNHNADNQVITHQRKRSIQPR